MERTNLSYKDDITKAFRRASNKLRVFSKGMSATSKVVTYKQMESAKRLVENEYENFVNSLSHDHQDRRDTQIYIIREDEDTVSLKMVGKQVLYDEFGTGDAGAMSSHPRKQAYPNLKPYNSGPYIRTSKNGGHYWRYYSDKDGRWATSTGVRAGAFMYKGLQKASNIREIQNAMGDEFKKVTGGK